MVEDLMSSHILLGMELLVFACVEVNLYQQKGHKKKK